MPSPINHGKVRLLIEHMRSTFFATLAAIMALSGHVAVADVTTNAPAAPASTLAPELHAIIDRINGKISNNTISPADLAPDLKALDELPGKHPADSVDDLAYVLTQEAEVYMQVLRDPTMTQKTLQRLVHDYPASKFTPLELENLKKLEPAIALQQTRAGLTNGVVFPDFQGKDLSGNPVSVGGLKGKIVLLDFWATWCPLCCQEMPAIAAAYKKYHSQGFEIIGINQDDDATAAGRFVKENQLAWPQYLDGDKKLAMKYGVEALPTNYLLDGQGRIIATGLLGEEIGEAVGKTLKTK